MCGFISGLSGFFFLFFCLFFCFFFPLIYISVFVPVQYCLGGCDFVVEPEVIILFNLLAALLEQFISSSLKKKKKKFHLDHRMLLFPDSLLPTVLSDTMCDLCVWLYSDVMFSFQIFIYLAM